MPPVGHPAGWGKLATIEQGGAVRPLLAKLSAEGREVVVEVLLRNPFLEIDIGLKHLD